jgi:hypothetical protein
MAAPPGLRYKLQQLDRNDLLAVRTRIACGIVLYL